jgi:AcrR family transcriptional regulator
VISIEATNGGAGKSTAESPAPAEQNSAATRELTARGKERRAQLLESAALMFAKNGYHPTAVSDIVAACGVGKGVFYWYFDSKEQLFHEILRNANYSLRRRQQSAIGAEADPLRRIDLGMHATMHWYVEHRHMFNLFQFASSETEFATTLRESQENSLNDAMRHVKEAMACGLIADGDPLFLTQALVGVTNTLARRFLLERHDDPDDVATNAVRFLFYGFGVTRRP